MKPGSEYSGNKRQRATKGSIIQLHVNGYYYYGQILIMGNCSFFDYRSTTPLEDLWILLERPVLFTICVYRDVISSGCWPKVGKLPIRDDLLPLKMKYIHHDYGSLEFELYNPNTGEVFPSSKEECRGLECCAIWDQNHVEDRLSDYYSGAPCIWLEKDRTLFQDIDGNTVLHP